MCEVDEETGPALILGLCPDRLIVFEADLITQADPAQDDPAQTEQEGCAAHDEQGRGRGGTVPRWRDDQMERAILVVPYTVIIGGFHPQFVPAGIEVGE